MSLYSRLGDRLDFIAGVDAVPEREVIDFTRNAYGELFSDFLINVNCCVLNGRNTVTNDFTSVRRQGGSAVVDYCVMPYESLDVFTDFEVIRARSLFEASGCLGKADPTRSISDHSALKWTVAVPRRSPVQANDSHDRQAPVSITKFDVRSIPTNFMNSPETAAAIDGVMAQLEESERQQLSLDAAYGGFCDIVESEMESHLPKRCIKLRTGISNKKRRVKKEWWTAELSDMWDTVCVAERDWASCHGARKAHYKQLLSAKRKAFDTAVQRAKRKHWWEVQEKLMCDSTVNKRHFWKEIGKLGIAKDRMPSIPMEVVVDEDGSVSTDPTIVLDRWRSAFSELLNVAPPTDAPDARDGVQPQPGAGEELPDSSPLNEAISVEEVIAALRRAKDGKATGCDGIPVEVLRNEATVSFLHRLFNVVFSTGVTPSSWRKCVLNPIPKNATSDPREPTNYRGIALASSVYKLYCGVLNFRLSEWAEHNDLLSDTQNGFRKGRSTTDHLGTLASVIETRKLQRKSTFVAFIDFRKAYDSINRSLLWTKLWDVGVRGVFHAALRSLYVDSLYSVRVNGHTSDWFSVSCGLRQGCLLSPILFNFYINDLSADIQNAGYGIDIGDDSKLAVLLYADDVALLAEDAEQLQFMLDILGRWCTRWQLHVNSAKSAVMHFRTPATPQSASVFTCGQQAIPTVTKYKYLGLLFTDHLDYETMASTAASSASRALGVIISKAKALGGMPFATFSKLYDSMVWPILDYGAAVWGSREFSAVNAVHHRACRFFLGVRKHTPNAAVNGDMGWTLPIERQWRAASRHWHRLCGLGAHRLTRTVFTWALEHATRGRPVRNWLYRIQQQFECLGLRHEGSPAVTASTAKGPFLRSVSVKLQQARDRVWHTDVNRVQAKRGAGLNKLRTYRTFKDSYQTENYVKAVLPRSHRAALASFRCGTAPLRIETGRYEGLPVESRTCFVCDDVTETEAHVLMTCPLYEDIRTDLFLTAGVLCADFNVWSDEEKFRCLLADELLVKFSARACRRILDRRATFIYCV